MRPPWRCLRGLAGLLSGRCRLCGCVLCGGRCGVPVPSPCCVWTGARLSPCFPGEFPCDHTGLSYCAFWQEPGAGPSCSVVPPGYPCSISHVRESRSAFVTEALFLLCPTVSCPCPPRVVLLGASVGKSAESPQESPAPRESARLVARSAPRVQDCSFTVPETGAGDNFIE